MAQLIRPLRQWPRINLHCCCPRAGLSSLLSSYAQSLTTPTAGHCFIFSGSFSVVSFNRNLNFQSRGLMLPNAPLPSSDYQEEDASDSDVEGRKSRNKRKRDARRAVRWGMELASFSTPQIERIVRGASLEEEVFEALMLVKRLKHDVREGKRRQFNYIGKLLREVEPELMDALIQATKDGDHIRLQDLCGAVTPVMEDDNKETEQPDQEEEDEDSDECIDIATRWFDGLINNDIKITNEVYSINSIEFDRQELRKLVREVHKIEERQATTSENEGEVEVATTRAMKSLNRFLRSLAKQISSDINSPA